MANGIIAGIIVTLIIALIVLVVLYRKFHYVVPFNEVHVLSKKKPTKTYDGKGRYFYIPIFHSRTVIPKHVLDIEPGLLDLHDIDNLPFGVEISIKVQVMDPQKAAATLTAITHNTVSKVVEDTVMSAARSIAMERTILEIMKQREEIEQDVYAMVSDSLAKLGLSAIIFDIKNITDIADKDVIGSLERKKISELEKDARIAEANNESEAIKVEVEKKKNSKVKSEQMRMEEQKAELLREQEVSEQQRLVQKKKLEIKEQEQTKLAEI